MLAKERKSRSQNCFCNLFLVRAAALGQTSEIKQRARHTEKISELRRNTRKKSPTLISARKGKVKKISRPSVSWSWNAWWSRLKSVSAPRDRFDSFFSLSWTKLSYKIGNFLRDFLEKLFSSRLIAKVELISHKQSDYRVSLKLMLIFISSFCRRQLINLRAAFKWFKIFYDSLPL